MGNGRAVAEQQEGGKSARAFQIFNLNHKPKLNACPNVGRVAEGFIMYTRAKSLARAFWLLSGFWIGVGMLFYFYGVS